MAPAGEADGGGGSVDRGDDFTPTDADLEAGQDALTKAEREAEARAAKETKETKETKGDADDVDPEDPDADLEVDPKKKNARIPLDRHEKILAKEREARATAEADRQAAVERLAQYEKGQQVTALNDDITKLEDSVAGMEKDYIKLLADGEIEKATAKMREIRTTERQINEAKNDFKMQASIAQATEQARYNVALERVEDAYPVLNPDHDDFDKAALGDVVEWKIFYERQRNMTPTKALQAAVKKVIGSDTKAQEKATEVAPKVDAKDVAAERKKAAVAKTLDATSKTPASTAKVGIDSDKAGGSLSSKDVMKMSQDDFKKLPDDVLARMRGDEFV
jgi:hypothetical protein